MALAAPYDATERPRLRGAAWHRGQPWRRTEAGEDGTGGTCGGWPRRRLKDAARPVDAARRLRRRTVMQWWRHKSDGVDTQLAAVDLRIAGGSHPRGALGAGSAFRKRAVRDPRVGAVKVGELRKCIWRSACVSTLGADFAGSYAVVACQRDVGQSKMTLASPATFLTLCRPSAVGERG